MTPARKHSVTPDWIAETWRAGVADVVAFARTAAAVLARPRQFGRQWASGERKALNPFAFMATSAALLGAAQLLLFGLTGGGRLSSAVALVAPYLHFACLGLLAHGALRLLGSRQSVRTSLGVALYVGGAPALAFTLFFYALTIVLRFATHLSTFDDAFAQLPHPAHLAIHVLIRVGFVAVAVYFGAALVGSHQVRAWKGAVAIVVALTVTGVVYGFVRPPATTGAHLVVWLRSEPGSEPPHLGLRF